MPKMLIVLILILPLSGCYYMQAASGQWEVMRKREPVAEVIADPKTSPQLAAKLSMMTEAREFSIDVLHLPDNDSYRSYADLQREYVVWNIFAAPEFSLQPKKWCFPIVGCVSYRGYFSKTKAYRKSEQLRDKGFDVAVGGVPAYSTLGNFSDPILNTMMQWDDVRLLALLFHELAHQVLYIKDDSAFNESFATAVEEFGVRTWLDSKADDAAYSAYLSDRNFRRHTTQIIADARQDLQQIYALDDGDEQMREKKQLRFARLSDELHSYAGHEGRTLSNWYGESMNNAHLISTALYEGLLPQFRLLLKACEQDIECFYEAARDISELHEVERERLLSTCDLRHFRRCLDTQ